MEHRAKGSSDTWTGQKTGKHQLVITFQVESALENRVAAETCIGRSEFSPVVDTESAIEEDNLEEEKESCLLPPAELKVASVTHNTAELQWTPSSGDYQVWRTVWREEQIPRWELRGAVSHLANRRVLWRIWSRRRNTWRPFLPFPKTDPNGVYSAMLSNSPLRVKCVFTLSLANLSLKETDTNFAPSFWLAVPVPERR